MLPLVVWQAPAPRPDTATVEARVAAPAAPSVVGMRLLAPEPAPLHREPASSLAIGAGAIADSGMLASWGWGATLGVHGRFGDWGLGLYGLWLPEQALSLAEGGVDFGLLGAGLRGCYRALEGVLGIDACLGLELDSLSASPYGMDNGEQSWSLLYAPLASVAFQWRALEHGSLVSRLDGLVPRPQRAYEVATGEQRQQIHEIPAFVVRLSLGVEVDLLWR